MKQPIFASPDDLSAVVSELTALYERLLDSWNRRVAADFAAFFAPDGSLVGFDGSPINGQADIERHLANIFADHIPASYVGKSREVRLLAPTVAMLRGVAGMVPPGQTRLNPTLNVIQTLVAVRQGSEWRIAMYQNTPALFHGQPGAVEALTQELTELLP